MVLDLRPRWWLLPCALLLASCEQSLFDEGTGPGGAGPGPDGATCPAECIGDAARDFNAAAPAGWRYVEDTRNRAWAPMTADGKRAVGADAGNAITTCKDKPSAPACAELPGALLVSTAGAAAAADPAIELELPAKRVVKVTVSAYVPSDAPEQQIRIYRNAREDSLFTGPAAPGTLFQQEVSVDVLPKDRLVVALAPASGGAKDIALDVFVSDVGTPSSCQMGLTFEEAGGTKVRNSCGADLTSYRYEDVGADTEIAATYGTSAFAELGQAASLPNGFYYKGSDILNKNGDTTIQFWMKVNTISTVSRQGGWAFSDMDLNDGGGIGLVAYQFAEYRFGSETGTSNAFSYGPFSGLGTWKFVRLVHAQGEIRTCLDGRRISTFPFPARQLQSTFPVHLGKNVVWTPQGAFFDGMLDDVRVLSVAYPCE